MKAIIITDVTVGAKTSIPLHWFKELVCKWLSIEPIRDSHYSLVLTLDSDHHPTHAGDIVVISGFDNWYVTSRLPERILVESVKPFSAGFVPELLKGREFFIVASTFKEGVPSVKEGETPFH